MRVARTPARIESGTPVKKLNPTSCNDWTKLSLSIICRPGSSLPIKTAGHVSAGRRARAIISKHWGETQGVEGLGDVRSVAPAPLAAPPPRQSEGEAFRNSFGRGCAQPRCLSQFRLSSFGRRAGTPPLRRMFAPDRTPPSQWGKRRSGDGWQTASCSRQRLPRHPLRSVGERMIG